jgi:ABC-type amino acid transport substrate-binding protein
MAIFFVKENIRYIYPRALRRHGASLFQFNQDVGFDPDLASSIVKNLKDSLPPIYISIVSLDR